MIHSVAHFFDIILIILISLNGNNLINPIILIDGSINVHSFERSLF